MSGLLPALGRSMPDLHAHHAEHTSAAFGHESHIPSALWEEPPRRRTSKAGAGSIKLEGARVLDGAVSRRSQSAAGFDPQLESKLFQLVEWVRETAAEEGGNGELGEPGLSSERAMELYTRAMVELQVLMSHQSRPLGETFEILFQGYRQASKKTSAATYVNEVSRLAEAEGRLAAEAEAKLERTEKVLEEAQFSLRVEEQKVEAVTARADRLALELDGAIGAKEAAGYGIPAMQQLIDQEKAASAELAEQFDTLMEEHEETKASLLRAQQRNLEHEENLRQHNIEAGEATVVDLDSPRTLLKEIEVRLAERDEDVKMLEATIKRMTLDHAQAIMAMEQQTSEVAGQSNLVGARPPGSGIPGPRDNRIADQEPEPEEEEVEPKEDPVLAAHLDDFWGYVLCA